MSSTLLIALRMTALTLVLAGLVYPFAVSALARLLFPYRAGGSLVTDGQGPVLGSELVGQSFSTPAYVWPRPSAAGATGYDGTASSGSNLGPTSQKLRDRIAAEIMRLRMANPEAPPVIPADLVTASASGLDPHLSPAGALWQVPRVARARGIAVERVRAVVDAYVEGPDLGVFGMPRVNVLLLNLALDRQFGKPYAP